MSGGSVPKWADRRSPVIGSRRHEG